MSESILILGGGVMQLPAVRLAAAKGWRVAVSGQAVLPEIEALADSCHADDLRNQDAVLVTAREIRRVHGLDGVFTAGTDFSTTVAWVAEHLQLPGISYAHALQATDKARMRACFDRTRVPSPRFYTVGRCGDGQPELSLSFPLVVKPVDNMGARGVRRVDNSAELNSAVDQAIGQSRSGTAIVEEYLDGPELSLDAIVHQGRITICGIADRHIFFPPHFVEMGHTMPTRLSAEQVRQAEDVFKRGIQALGIDNGAAKGDIKMTARGAVVGEIAARLSGGYMSGWTYPYASGVNLTEAAMNIAVGLPPGNLEPSRRHFAAERAFLSIPGQVGELIGVQEARLSRGIQDVFLRTKAGERVNFPIDNMGKCGNVIARADTRRQAINAAQKALQRIVVRLAVNDPQTNAFLWGMSRLPAAFSPGPGFTREVMDLPNKGVDLSDPASGVRLSQTRMGRGIAVLQPSSSLDPIRDWHGLSLQQALDRVLDLSGALLVPHPSSDYINVGSLFWTALLRGSVQGGLYLLDTLGCSPNQCAD